MKLKKIAITNYRQFQNAVINFDDELTILAGANNSGKTSIIELFKRIFKDKNFSKEDISAEYYSKLQYDFISCINKIYNITDKETEFRENVKKEFSTENNNKWTAIKIKIEVQYDKNESISLFSDYLMELSDTCTSFFFLFNYEVNITELNKLLSLNATNLLDKKHEIQKLEAGRKTNKTRIKLTELQAEYEEFLKEIFDGALENRVYFADQNYENAGQISVREFQSLFNYKSVDLYLIDFADLCIENFRIIFYVLELVYNLRKIDFIQRNIFTFALFQINSLNLNHIATIYVISVMKYIRPMMIMNFLVWR